MTSTSGEILWLTWVTLHGESFENSKMELGRKKGSLKCPAKSPINYLEGFSRKTGYTFLSWTWTTNQGIKVMTTDKGSSLFSSCKLSYSLFIRASSQVFQLKPWGFALLIACGIQECGSKNIQQSNWVRGYQPFPRFTCHRFDRGNWCWVQGSFGLIPLVSPNLGISFWG